MRHAGALLTALTGTMLVVATGAKAQTTAAVSLAADITQAILEGRHPRNLTAARLMRNTRFPLDRTERREVLGFA